MEEKEAMDSLRAHALCMLGLELLNKGEYGKAGELFGRALDIEPDDKLALHAKERADKCQKISTEEIRAIMKR